MSEELFTIPESKPSELELARRRFARAEEAFEDARELEDKQGPESRRILRDAEFEYEAARREVEHEEAEALRETGCRHNWRHYATHTDGTTFYRCSICEIEESN